MTEFTDGVTRYKIKNGVISPRDEFSRYLRKRFKKFEVPAYVPDAELAFVQQQGLEVLNHEPEKIDENLVY